MGLGLDDLKFLLRLFDLANETRQELLIFRIANRFKDFDAFSKAINRIAKFLVRERLGKFVRKVAAFVF